MTQQFSNNGTGTLSAGITNVQTSLVLNTGDGANFPVLTGSDFFYATLLQIVAGVETNWEIIKVTARASDTFTIVRGQQSTTARAFNTGDPVQLRWTKGDADNAIAPKLSIPVRQTVLSGALTAAGLPNLLAAGSGLALNLSATAVAVQLAFAAGFSAAGEVDFISQLTADVTGVVSSLAANNTSYISATYVDVGSVTWNKTLVPPQYGYSYDRTKQSLLRFGGADASTSFIDDYGNTWTAVGNAQVDTAVQIDTLNTLLLDGTGDYAECTNFTSLGGGSWTMECKIRWNTLPAASAQTFFAAGNAGTFGMQLALNDTAGTKKLALWLSSNGTAWDLANALLGTSTTWVAATTYHIAITYDALAGKYFVYKDGVAEAAQTITSASRICAITKIRVGVDGAAASGVNGAIAGFRFSPYCRYPNGTTFTAPNISTFAVEGDYFCIPQMVMYTVSAASSSAGTDPTMTAMNEVYVGECDTSGAAVTAVRNYAYQGRFTGAYSTSMPAAATKSTVSPNIGTTEYNAYVEGIVRTATDGYSPGEVVTFGGFNNAYVIPAMPQIVDRNTVAWTTGGTSVVIINSKTTGNAGSGVTSSTSVGWRVRAQRSF